MMLTTESPVNDEQSSFPNLWRENLEKAQHYKVPTPLSSVYQNQIHNKTAVIFCPGVGFAFMKGNAKYRNWGG